MAATGATVAPVEREPHSREDREDTLISLSLVAAAAIFYIAPWPALYWPAFLVLAALTWLRLDLALLLVPLFAPTFMAPKHLGRYEFAPSELFVLLDCAIYLLGLVLHRRHITWSRLRGSPFLLPAGLLLVGATVSTALAVDRHHALEWYRWVILEPLAYGALLLLVSTRRSWPWIAGGLVAAGLWTGLIGLWQYATHTDLTVVPGTSIERIHALYGSPDNLGLLYDRVLPLWLAIGISWWLNVQTRILWWLAGVPMVVALALTSSRGAWLAIAAGVLLVLALRFPWGRYVVVGAALVALAGLAIEGPRLSQFFRSNQANTAQSRVYIWESAIHMVRDHPIFGVGPDNFLHYYTPTAKEDPYNHLCAPGLGYMEPASGGLEPCLSHPHDEVLDFWLSTGVIGLAAFVWIEVVFWHAALRTWRRRESTSPGWRYPLLLGSMAAMLAALVHGAVDNSYFLIDLAIIFWLLCSYVSWIGTESDARG